jgi:hypothetical protein
MTSDNRGGDAPSTAARRKSDAFDYRSHRLWKTDYMRRPSDLAALREARAREKYWLKQMGLPVPRADL